MTLELESSLRMSERMVEYRVVSPALGASSDLRVLSPPGGAGGLPVLWLLHGSDDDHLAWSDDGRVEALTEGLQLVVVMPDCGPGGWYSDWRASDGPAGAQQWETYHLDELLPWVDTTLGVRTDRRGRAIAGNSMGGYGAIKYAARRPDLFGVAAAFSGALDILDPNLGVFADALASMNGGRPGDMWGPHDGDRSEWRVNNPVDLAAGLADVRVELRTGNGSPGGAYDRPGDAERDLIETTLHGTCVTMHERLEELGIDHVWDDYGPGRHEWPYWADALSRTLPTVIDHAG